jgi:hypothetical protein
MVPIAVWLAVAIPVSVAADTADLQGEWWVLQSRWVGGMYVYQPGSTLVFEKNHYALTTLGDQLAVQTGAVVPATVGTRKALFLVSGGNCYPCVYCLNERYLYIHYEHAGAVYTLVARRPFP